MNILNSLAFILVAGALCYRLTMKVIEKYHEAWIDDRGFGVHIMVYTMIYLLMAIYAVS
ncbi:hypothetical protein [Thermococcus sp.]|uniref:hypothetical protein n=1 Tax=Thermococcus sp. TaxID=35749 RepID=UPI0025F263CA|nr:hypothetical protein [Thermococcus sp.]